jgi:hypothetical protein
MRTKEDRGQHLLVPQSHPKYGARMGHMGCTWTTDNTWAPLVGKMDKAESLRTELDGYGRFGYLFLTNSDLFGRVYYV